jgi:hypothetical protein
MTMKAMHEELRDLHIALTMSDGRIVHRRGM